MEQGYKDIKEKRLEKIEKQYERDIDCINKVEEQIKMETELQIYWAERNAKVSGWDPESAKTKKMVDYAKNSKSEELFIQEWRRQQVTDRYESDKVRVEEKF